MCWRCIFPLSLGSVQVGATVRYQQSRNLQLCPACHRFLFVPAWPSGTGSRCHDGRQPFAWLYGQSGASVSIPGKTGMGTARKHGAVNGAYHVHWYKYPPTYRLNIITRRPPGRRGHGYSLSVRRLDPTLVDSSLTTILNPEAILVCQPHRTGRPREVDALAVRIPYASGCPLLVWWKPWLGPACLTARSRVQPAAVVGTGQ